MTPAVPASLATVQRHLPTAWPGWSNPFDSPTKLDAVAKLESVSVLMQVGQYLGVAGVIGVVVRHWEVEIPCESLGRY